MSSSEESPSPHSTLVFIATFEGGLVFVAAIAGRIVGVDPLESVTWSTQGAGWGLVGSLPLVGLLLICVRSTWSPLLRIRETVDEVVGRFFGHASWVEIGVISLLAGLGEEMLFRGVLQTGVAGWIGGTTGTVIGLVAASVVFGAGHAVHTPYFLLATAMGAYFGGLYLYFDNLLVPIVVHAVYDFIAIGYLRRRLPMNETDTKENVEA